MRKDAITNGRPLSEADTHSVGKSHMAMEWCGPNSWRLPSGQALAEFALQAGFLAPLLFKTEPASAHSVEDAKHLSKAGQP